MRRDAAAEPLQASLFDLAAEPLPAAASAPQPAVLPSPSLPSLQPPSLQSPSLQSPSLPPRPALPSSPQVPSDRGLEPEVFRHPQAQREIRLEQHRIAYALKRVRRRSIGFIVGAEGLCVNAPKWVGVRDIEAALQEKSGWILRKLGEQRERAQRLQAARIDWRDGAAFPFLGRTVTVVLDARVAGALFEPGDATALVAGGVVGVSGAPGGSGAFGVSSVSGLSAASGASGASGASEAPDFEAAGAAPRLRLRIGLPPHAAPEQIRDAVQSWLQRQARRVFEERCRHYALRLGVRCTRLSLSSAQTRWGSASSSGAIRLNWRLIHFTLPTIDYVVSHELAHLREMNHSPRFWDLVRSVAPDYERAREVLKTQTVPPFD